MSRFHLSSPIRWIAFDITETLLTFFPSIGEIYANAALKAYLPSFLSNPSSISSSPELFQTSFIIAYRKISKEYPCYGYPYNVQCRSERDWWKKVVEETLKEAIRRETTAREGEGEGEGEGDIRMIKEEDFQRYFRLVYQSFASPKSYSIFPDALEFLHYLTKEAKTTATAASSPSSTSPSYSLGIITNSPLRTVETTLPCLGLENYFSFFVSSCDEGFLKPQSEIFQRALREIHFYDSHQQQQRNGKGKEKGKGKEFLTRREEVLYIGNHLVCDYQGAKNFGFQSILIGKKNLLSPFISSHLISSLTPPSLFLFSLFPFRRSPR